MARTRLGQQDQTVRLWAADGTPGPVLRGIGRRHGRGLESRRPCGSPPAAATDRAALERRRDRGPDLEWECSAGFRGSLERRWQAGCLGGRDGTVRLWDADGTPQALGRFNGTADCVAWSPDGRRIAAGPRGRRAIVGCQAGALGPLLHGHSGLTTAIAWHPDSARLVVGNERPTVQTWTSPTCRAGSDPTA